MYCLSFPGVFVYISAAQGVADHIRRDNGPFPPIIFLKKSPLLAQKFPAISSPRKALDPTLLGPPRPRLHARPVGPRSLCGVRLGSISVARLQLFSNGVGWRVGWVGGFLPPKQCPIDCVWAGDQMRGPPSQPIAHSNCFPLQTGTAQWDSVNPGIRSPQTGVTYWRAQQTRGRGLPPRRCHRSSIPSLPNRFRVEPPATVSNPHL